MNRGRGHSAKRQGVREVEGQEKERVHKRGRDKIIL